MGKLFGTDGIRGEANVAPMTADMALKLGRALAHRFAGAGNGTGSRPRIVIGKDTRLSGYIFEQALAAGICSMGADVWLCGPLPTPGIAFITKSMRADAGVVISASHNPFYDNGIKLFGHDGFKLPDEVESELETMVLQDRFAEAKVDRANLGRAHRIEEAWARYVVFLKAVMAEDLQLDGLRIVVDCAHGAAYKVAPAVFEELGAEVIAIGCRPDGTNINAGCGSLHPERMCEAIRMYNAHLGIALDGDADRVIVADEKGNVVDGDQLMAMVALHMKKSGELANDTVVATVMSNLGLEIALRREGIKLVRTAVGDRHVVARMRADGHNVGGEQSGHIVFLDHTSTGDGVLAGLKILTLMLREGKPLSELANVMERVPQVLINIRVTSKPPISELAGVSALIASVEKSLGDEGRVLVRYSGTEPKARVMVEGLDQAVIQKHADEIVAALQTEIGA
ncbi:MAG: phosphoglucosamine mutase [Myxococcota bacterium]|jgi:phosphoglucosamine mutase